MHPEPSTTTTRQARKPRLDDQNTRAFKLGLLRGRPVCWPVMFHEQRHCRPPRRGQASTPSGVGQTGLQTAKTDHHGDEKPTAGLDLATISVPPDPDQTQRKQQRVPLRVLRWSSSSGFRPASFSRMTTKRTPCWGRAPAAWGQGRRPAPAGRRGPRDGVWREVLEALK